MRWYRAMIIAVLLLDGCSTTPRELRARDPLFTRTATGEAEAFARCVQEDLEDKHGGAFGTMGGVAFETRHEGSTIRLVGRSATLPSQARFDLAIAPIGPGQVEVQLRMAAPRWPQESAVTDAVDDRAQQQGTTK
jgi:hypothetical protein